MKQKTPKKNIEKKTIECCHSALAPSSNIPDHSLDLNRLNRIRGQIDGIKKMIEERRYCPDILTQTSAIRAAISSLESSILERHLNACVKSAFNSNSENSSEKIKELLEIFKKKSR